MIPILSEERDYLVLNKPPGIAVSPPYFKETVVEWLIKTRPEFQSDLWPEGELPGQVHRLDADTSGILVVAKNPEAQKRLRLLWQGRQVKKRYLAIVYGEIGDRGVIELAIERRTGETKQKIVHLPSDNSRPSLTRYQKLSVAQDRKNLLSLVLVEPVTGRTHQIRVHLSAIGHPILGDKLYATKPSRKLSLALSIPRQLLHAFELEIDNRRYQAEPPPDFENVLRTYFNQSLAQLNQRTLLIDLEKD